MGRERSHLQKCVGSSICQLPIHGIDGGSSLRDSDTSLPKKNAAKLANICAVIKTKHQRTDTAQSILVFVGQVRPKQHQRGMIGLQQLSHGAVLKPNCQWPLLTGRRGTVDNISKRDHECLSISSPIIHKTCTLGPGDRGLRIKKSIGGLSYWAK